MLERNMIALKTQDKLEIQTVNGHDLAPFFSPLLKLGFGLFEGLEGLPE